MENYEKKKILLYIAVTAATAVYIKHTFYLLFDILVFLPQLSIYIIMVYEKNIFDFVYSVKIIIILYSKQIRTRNNRSNTDRLYILKYPTSMWFCVGPNMVIYDEFAGSA